MTKHDQRLAHIQARLRGCAYTLVPYDNSHVFHTTSSVSADLMKTYWRTNRLYRSILDPPAGDGEGSATTMVLHRQRCKHCDQRWSDHVPAGGQCLFDTVRYTEGPL